MGTPPAPGEGPQGATTFRYALHPAGQTAFLLRTFLWLPLLYFYPDANNQVLQKLYEESTMFFLFQWRTNFSLLLYSLRK